MTPDIFNSNLFEPTYSNIEKAKKHLYLDQSEDEDDFINIERRNALTELRILQGLHFYVFQINSTLYLMPIPNKWCSGILSKSFIKIFEGVQYLIKFQAVGLHHY